MPTQFHLNALFVRMELTCLYRQEQLAQSGSEKEEEFIRHHLWVKGSHHLLAGPECHGTGRGEGGGWKSPQGLSAHIKTE